VRLAGAITWVVAADAFSRRLSVVTQDPNQIGHADLSLALHGELAPAA
jgi:hypothetical protein